MDIDKKALAAAVAAALGGVTLAARRRSRVPDPAHAPGHHHLGPPPEVADPHVDAVKPDHDQPWIRTTHLDSQRRRFRR
jgi:hypothetical protein